MIPIMLHGGESGNQGSAHPFSKPGIFDQEELRVVIKRPKRGLDPSGLEPEHEDDRVQTGVQRLP
jgi:hypothetical protein